MIALDTNILVYAHRPEAPLHEAARRTVEELAQATKPWAIVLHSLVEFAAIASNPRVWKKPSSARDIDAQVRAWLESPSLRVLGEEREFWPVFAQCLTEARTSGGAVHDTRIAAACRYHGVAELWTSDRDFSRYPWLVTRNPLLE